MYLSPEQKEFVLAHEQDDVRNVALRYNREDMLFLLSQISGRKIAAKKVPSWYKYIDIIYPQHVSLEQASSELMALYKTSLISRKLIALGCDSLTGTFVDLTGGMGIDFSFLAQHFSKAIYVEKNDELCRIAEHNFHVLGLEEVTVCCEAAEFYLKETAPVDLIYIDPSRRDDVGRKLFRIEDCSPDLSTLKSLLLKKARLIMIKYSPMLDISSALKILSCVSEVHVVSVNNECKELLFILSDKDSAENNREGVFNQKQKIEPLFIAINLKQSGREESFSFTPLQEKNANVLFAKTLGKYLYEPNTSILKAGAFKSVSEAYSLLKLHINSHLYTSDELIENFPGRIFEVETFFVPNKKNIKTFIHQTKRANITVRNFPMTVADIRRKTGIEDGGDIYLFATTLSDEQKIWLVCKKYAC